MRGTDQTDGALLMARCDLLARFSERPDALTRRFLTASYRQALDWVADWMREAGMETRIDAAGNLIGRYDGTDDAAPSILMGSHIDTVENAGRYDGMLGVLAAIACVARLHRDRRCLRHPVEVAVFGDEEGARFGIAMIGSRAFAGCLPPDWLDQTDADGISLRQAMVAWGLDPGKLDDARRDPASVVAYLEVHIEQGVRLEQVGLAVGRVSGTCAIRRLRITLRGESGHAGTVGMDRRRDALAGAAEIVLAIEAQSREGGCIATAGGIACRPGAANVIAAEAQLLVDLRASDDDCAEVELHRLLERAEDIARLRGLTLAYHAFYTAHAAHFPSSLGRLADRALSANGLAGGPVLVSQAGHDAAVMAGLSPSVMLFTRCRDGVSHSPAEAISSADATASINALSSLCELVDAAESSDFAEPDK